MSEDFGSRIDRLLADGCSRIQTPNANSASRSTIRRWLKSVYTTCRTHLRRIFCLFSRNANMSDSGEEINVKKGVILRYLVANVDPDAEKLYGRTKILLIAESLHTMSYNLFVYLRGEGPLKTISEFLRLSRTFHEHTNILLSKVRVLSAKFLYSYKRERLMMSLNRMPDMCKNLRMILKSTAVGMRATVSKMEDIVMAIHELMNEISDLVTICFECETSRRSKIRETRKGHQTRNLQFQDENNYLPFRLLFYPPSDNHARIIAALNSDHVARRISDFYVRHTKHFDKELQDLLLIRHLEPLFTPVHIPEEVGAACLRVLQFPMFPNADSSKLFKGNLKAIECLLKFASYHRTLSQNDDMPPAAKRPKLGSFKEISVCAGFELQL